MKLPKHCINCYFPKPKCFLCSDCWRVAIVSPLVIAAVGFLASRILHFLFRFFA